MMLQARQFLESNATEAEQTKSAYSAGLHSAQTFAQASLIAIAPELQQIPIERWAEAVQIISQTDPLKGQMLSKTLGNAAAIAERQQLVQYHEQTQRQAQFDSLKAQYSRASDQVLGPMTHAEKLTMAEELADYVGEHGVSRQVLMEEAKTNLLLHHPAFQSLAKDAISYRRMQKAAKGVPTRPHVPVTKPGISTASRGNSNASAINALERQLSNATSHAAIKIAAKLQQLKRG
jgi:hypothetical protein